MRRKAVRRRKSKGGDAGRKGEREIKRRKRRRKRKGGCRNKKGRGR